MSAPSQPLRLHPDRLLPASHAALPVARRLYEHVKDAPIVSPHTHIPAELLLHDEPFPDPTTLLITSDHYVTRILNASGIPQESLVSGEAGGTREIWRLFCARWDGFRGTATRYWLEVQLGELFGVDMHPHPDTADYLYDHISERLQSSEFRPRALYRRFGVQALATTDDPASDLSAHRALAQDPEWQGRVIPTFRPDRFFEIDAPGWAGALAELGESAAADVGSYESFVAALMARRRFFVDNGAAATDHSHLDAGIAPIPEPSAREIFDKALAGTVNAAEARAFRRHMLFLMAELSADDGLVMLLHPGVVRNHHGPTYEAHGPDTGHDIPVATEYTRALQPVLERLGMDPNFRLVLFTLDEAAVSREIAPLAGFYPSVFVGAPWWFLDSPVMIRRFWEALSEIAGFSRYAGFIDDTRALCSLPARHDMARRTKAAFLATCVAEHRLSVEDAESVIADLVMTRPVETFRLGLPAREPSWS